MVTSQPFTVSRGTIFMNLVKSTSYAWPLWIVLAIGLIFTTLGCFLDVRYIILGLIVCLIVLPSMAFYIFVHYMFASEMVANLLHHTVERRQSGYLLRIFRRADQNDPLEEGKIWIESGRLSFFDSNIVKTKTTSEYDIIFFKDSPLEILYIPKF